MEKAKEVVGTIDRFHQLSLDIPGVVVDLQIATFEHFANCSSSLTSMTLFISLSYMLYTQESGQ